MFNETDDDVKRILLTILYEGFTNVYMTVLYNAFDDVLIEGGQENTLDSIMSILKGRFKKVDWDEDIIKGFISSVKKGEEISLYRIIIRYSLLKNQVFDIANGEFSDSVINSLQTDNEILKATIDLISILIVGNQMLVTQKHNF